MTRNFLLSLVISGSVTVHAGDWPQWRGPNRDGISTETNRSAAWPATGPKQLWKTNVGIGCSSMAVSQGRLFTLGNSNETDIVVGLEAATGKVLWQYSYPCSLAPRMYEGGPGATPTVDGDRVYTLSRSGHLFCLAADTGKVIWAKHLQDDLAGKMPTWGYTGSPLVLGAAVLVDVGAPGAAVVAFDKQSGKILWQAGDEPAAYSSLIPFQQNGQLFVAAFNAFGLVLRAAGTGKELAHVAWKTSYDANAATPIIAGNRFFISSGYNKGAGLFQLTGNALTELWVSRDMRNHFNSCVLRQEHLYGFDESALTCLSFATGRTLWRQEGLGKGSLLLTGDRLIIQTEDGRIVVAEASATAYKELASAKVLNGRCWVVPVLANGRLYVRNNAGDLGCLELPAAK